MEERKKKPFRLITNLSNEKDKGEEMTPQKLLLATTGEMNEVRKWL